MVWMGSNIHEHCRQYFLIHVSQEVFPSASVNKDDFSHCENVVSHMIEPSYGRNLKSKVFSS